MKPGDVMKKLLIATDNFLPRWDGVSRFLSEIIPRLESDFEISVAAPRFRGELKGFERVNIRRFRVMRFQVGDINLAWPDGKEIESMVGGADIVWVQTLGPIGALSLLKAKKLKKPVIAFIHSIEWELYSKGVKSFKALAYVFAKIYARWLYRKCNILMVPSLEVEELFNYSGIMTEKKVVHLGIDVGKFFPVGDKAEAKKKVGINPEHKVIGYTGRIAREKDIMTLYRAFASLRMERKDAVLLLVGDGIESYKRMLSSDENVILPGAVSNIQDYLQAMDVFVLPSLTETSSLATMEAMACGIPVVTTKVGFVKRYVKDRENGLFFPNYNDTVLRLKLDWLLNRPETMKRLGENARQTIMEKYQWSSTVERVRTILDSIEVKDEKS
jgi:glycosyltransferase involved in cell wall biosynthesis